MKIEIVFFFVLILLLPSFPLPHSSSPPILAAAPNDNSRSKGSGFSENYTTYQQMVEHLERLEHSYPSIFELEKLETTWEGRTVYGIKISDKDNLTEWGSKEPELLFIGGHHANELISVEVPLSLIDYLVTHYETDYDVKNMVKNTEIWVVPMLNPDGHVYVENGNSNWRKNRRDNGDGSFGVDLNRNYGYKWGTDEHTSDEPSSDLYHGPEPFSEPETRAIKNLSAKHNFTFSLSFHSSGEYILFPWGYEHDAYTPDHQLLTRIAEKMSQINGYQYKKSSELYPAKGDSEDYLYSIGVLSFTIELAKSDAPKDPSPEIEKNIPICLYLIHSATKIARLQNTDYMKARLEKDSIRDYFNATAQWNWLIYMSGDSSLSSQVDDDLSLITSVKLPSYLRIIVLADKNENHDTKAYLITSKGKEELPLNSINSSWEDELRMDKIETLRDFIKWARLTYPSENTFLELWGHGKGWVYAVYEGSESRSMNAAELRMALQDGLELQRNQEKKTNKSLPLDVLGFDECAMSNLETLFEVAPLTNYYIGSEKDEPFDGWPYHWVIQELNKTSLLLPWHLSSTIANTIIDFYNKNPHKAGNIPVLFSVIRTADINLFKENALLLFQKLRNRISNPSFLNMLKEKRKNTEEYERENFVDFYHFLTLVNEDNEDFELRYYIEELLYLKDKIVLLNLKTKDEVGDEPKTENASGFTIYFPESGELPEDYTSLKFTKETNWHLFLYEYINGRKSQCYLEYANFSFQDVEEEEKVSTKILVEFSLYTEIEREDLTLIINTTKEGKKGETIYMKNLSLSSGREWFRLFFYKNFSGMLKVELIIYSSLFKNDTADWKGGEEVASAMTIFSRKADLFFERITIKEGKGLKERELYTSTSLPNQTHSLISSYIPLKASFLYTITLSISSHGFSSYSLFTAELDGEVIYQNSYFLRLNSSKEIELTLPFSMGDHTLIFILDKDDQVNETNESNNWVSFQLKAYSFEEEVHLSPLSQEVILDSFINEESEEEFPTIGFYINNTSPLDWNLSYFYAIKLIYKESGEPFQGEFSESAFSSMLREFEKNSFLKNSTLLLEPASEKEVRLEFRDYSSLMSFLYANEDVVVVLEVVFYSDENLTPLTPLRVSFILENGGIDEASPSNIEERESFFFFSFLIAAIGIVLLLFVSIYLRKLKRDSVKGDEEKPQHSNDEIIEIYE